MALALVRKGDVVDKVRATTKFILDNMEVLVAAAGQLPWDNFI